MSVQDEEGDIGKVAKRRKFFNWLLGLGILSWGGGISYTSIRYLTPPPKEEKFAASIALGTEAEILKHRKYKKKSGSMLFKFQGKPAILVRSDKGQYKAFNAVCTHLACIVTFKKDRDVFFCNCHGGVYSSDGKNIAGPPPSPLEEYVVYKKDGKIHVGQRAL